MSYNPGYQHILKDLKPSTRQRFVALDLTFPPPDLETRIVAHEGGVEAAGTAGESREPRPAACGSCGTEASRRCRAPGCSSRPRA